MYGPLTKSCVPFMFNKDGAFSIHFLFSLGGFTATLAIEAMSCLKSPLNNCHFWMLHSSAPT